MKKCILISLICSCVALCAIAGGNGSMSLQKFMRDRHVALGHNMIGNHAPRDLSIDDMTGCRIAVMETYDLQEDGTLDDVPYYLGWESQLAPWTYEDGTVEENFYSLTCNQNNYTLPIEIDLDSRMAYLYSYEVEYYEVSRKVGRYLYDTIMTVCVLPEAFLYEDEENCPWMVEGQVFDDGSIVFNDGFIYYTTEIVSKRQYTNHLLVSTDTTWSISPIYRNMLLLMPNGEHEFAKISQNVSVPAGNTSNLNHLISGFRSFANYRGTVGTCGYGGSVGTPIDPRPIKPGSLWEGFGTEVRSSGQGGNRLEDPEPESNKQTVPVFMYQPDDSTLIVYNLYGQGLVENYMVLHEDSVMSMPGQQIAFDMDNAVAVFNCSEDVENDMVVLGNSGIATSDSITWGLTIPYTEEGLLNYNYTGNKLRFTDGSQFNIPVVPAPVVLGDVNRDGEISIKDVTDLIDRLLTGNFEDADDFSIESADVDGDGEVSIGDAILLVDWLMLTHY